MFCYCTSRTMEKMSYFATLLLVVMKMFKFCYCISRTYGKCSCFATVLLVLMDTFHVLLLYCSYYGKNVIFCYFTACSYENVQVLLLHFSYLWKIFMFCSVLFERVCTQNSCSALTCQNILKLPYQFCPVVYINNCISDKRVTGYVRSGY